MCSHLVLCKSISALIFLLHYDCECKHSNCSLPGRCRVKESLGMNKIFNRQLLVLTLTVSMHILHEFAGIMVDC